MGSRRCRATRSAQLGCCRCQSPDRTSRRRGTGRLRRTTLGCLRRKPRPHMCRFAYRRCRRCSLSRLSPRDSSRCRSPDRTSRRCGTGRSRCTTLDCHQRKPRPCRCRFACTHSRRCSLSRLLPQDSSTSHSPDCTSQPRGTGHSPCTTSGCHQRKPRPRRCRFACTHSRRCSLFHLPLQD